MSQDIRKPINTMIDGSSKSAVAATEDERIWTLLSLYADGEASLAESTEVERLLAAVPAYSAELRFIKSSGEHARSIVEVEPPRSLRDAILASTVYRPSLSTRMITAWDRLIGQVPSPFARTFLPAAGALAAAVLITVAAGSLHMRNRTLSTDVNPGEAAIPAGPDSGKIAMNPGGPQLPPVVGPKREFERATFHRLKSRAAATGSFGSDVLPVEAHSETPHKIQVEAASYPVPSGGGVRPTTARSVGNGASKSPPAAGRGPAVMSGSVQVASAADSGSYSTLPNMDDKNYRQFGQASPSSNGAGLGNDVHIVSDSDPSPVHATTAAPIVHHGHLILSELPPAPMSSADIRRMQQASTLGYDRETLASIGRGQATVSLIGSKF